MTATRFRPAFRILPRPKRKIPVWLGGFSEAAFDRTARIGDGFLFSGRTQTEAIQIKARIVAKLLELGRDADAFGFESIQQYSRGDNQWPGDIAAWRGVARGWGKPHICRDDGREPQHGDSTVFTPSVKMAFSRALETMLTEQDHDGVLPGHQHSGYHFKSDTQSSEKMPVGYTGMIWVAFRPSDDECLYNFPIPVEIQAVQALNALAEMERFIGRRDMAKRAGTLGAQVKAGIEQYGIVDTPDYGRVYAYEVDGLGHANLMDDANIPSLLSIPYFGYVSEIDEIYMATRRFILSSSNPYFYEGTFKGEKISGIGSPHTPAGMIWPLAQEMQGMTTNQKDEQIRVLRMLLASDPGDHQPHESYAANNPKHFTRKDFAWAKAQFAEFVLRSILGRRPLPVPPKPERDTYVKNLPSQLTFSQVGGGFNAAPR
jgi:Metal-independent alpha-mannosidase (GH125)/Luciferase-like monooxygenase